MTLPHFALQSLGMVAHFPRFARFRRALGDVEGTQKRILQSYLETAAQTEWGKARGVRADWDWSDYSERLPLTEYKDWQPELIGEDGSLKSRILGRTPTKWMATSGSTSRRKWIPYTAQLLSEFDHAASAWIFDVARRFPGILQGRHYWSISWLPHDLRNKHATSDCELLPWWKRALMEPMMAVPSGLELMPSSEEAQLATLAYLSACNDLTLISVWSPTFALEFFRQMGLRKDELVEILSKGKWLTEGMAASGCRAPFSPRVAALLSDWDGKVSSDFFRSLWPKLALISAWDSSTSAPWAKELQALFPQVGFQGKGLWATEGVVTIPFEGQHLLAVTSHFYEWKCLDSGRIFPSWDLAKWKKGREVQPILSMGNGLFRYVLPDRMKVEGVNRSCPALSFQGRLYGEDLVGEKMDARSAEQVLAKLSAEFSTRCLSLVAQAPLSKLHEQQAAKPRYWALVQGGRPAEARRIRDRLEQLLQEFHHYRLARELGQLDTADLLLVRGETIDLYRTYARIREQTAAEELIPGETKIEPVILCRGDLPEV